MKFFIHTTGCKANQWDSYVITNSLKNSGFFLSQLAHADFIVVNGCTLTDGAERDLRRFINHSRSVNPNARIILVGCHAQVYPDQSFGADLVLGQSEKYRITEFLSSNGSFVKATRSIPMESVCINGLPHGRTRIFLKIQDGCDQFCSYCIVPFARGKSRSRNSSEIIQAMDLFFQMGINEVVLTGIEISAYKDPLTGIDLKGLLLRLEEERTPPRIRITSIDPLSIDEDCIHIIASSKKIMKSLHIPLQSGSDTILKRMGRRYSRDSIGDLIKRLNTMIHGIGIGMDVIVGFPGEDEDHFLKTVRFLESLDIYYLHVFPFSARRGTKAATMVNTVSDAEKEERVSILRMLDSVKRRKFAERFIGQKACILVEGKKHRNFYMRGYTENYIPVYVPYEKKLENRLVNVTITELRDNRVMGEPIAG